jgi:hypothetical protein
VRAEQPEVVRDEVLGAGGDPGQVAYALLPTLTKAAASKSRVGSENILARSAAPPAASTPGILPRISSALGASMQSRSQRSPFMTSF